MKKVYILKLQRVAELSKKEVCVQIKQLKSMHLARAYANAVVLPDGKVFITGGAYLPKEFSDEFAHFKPGVCCQ